jgi:hypothetical protein
VAAVHPRSIELVIGVVRDAPPNFHGRDCTRPIKRIGL